MRHRKNRSIFNARSRRKGKPASIKGAQHVVQGDDAQPLPAALNDNDRLTPRQRGFVRDADRVSDASSQRTILMDAVIAGNFDLALRIVRSGADVERTDKLGQTALHHAIKQGSPKLVTMLLERGANPNTQTKTKDTALMMALAKQETADLATVLLDAGADVTLADKAGVLPLHAAAQLGFIGGTLDVLTRIVEATPDPNRRDAKGATALHYAVRGGHQAVLEKLLYHRLDPLAATHDGQTCLHEAAKRSDTTCADVLLQGWAVELLNAVNHEGRTPLHLAVEVGHEGLAHNMLAQGALANQFDDKGMTPLHIAARAGKTSLVHLLLDQGATLDASDSKGNATPLLVALRAGQRSMARLLLDQGAGGNCADTAGITPLMIAATNSMYDLVEIMLEQGANPALKDNMGRNVLHWSGDGISGSLLSRLLLAGAELEARDKYERTPLLAALHDESTSVVHELLKAGANVKVQDDGGHAPLHIAIALQRPDLTAALINKGADLNVAEKTNGMTPMHVAAQTGQLNEVRRLMHHGVNPNILDAAGRTPLHWAINRNQGAVDVVRHLIDNGADATTRDRNGITPFDLAHTQRQDRMIDMFRAQLRKQGRSYTPRNVFNPYGSPPIW